jgi:hypothetical protein
MNHAYQILAARTYGRHRYFSLLTWFLEQGAIGVRVSKIEDRSFITVCDEDIVQWSEGNPALAGCNREMEKYKHE